MVDPLSTAAITQVILGLGFVMFLIAGCAYLTKKLQSGRSSGGKLIQVIASQALGTRERAVVVQVGKTQLLLGVSAGRVTTLHEFPEPLFPEGSSPSVGPSFVERLQEVLKRGQPT